MQGRISLPVLAKELGLNPHAALKVAERAGLPVKRYGVTLTLAQADKMRAQIQRDREAEEARVRRWRESERRAAEAVAKMHGASTPVRPVGALPPRPLPGPAEACKCCGIEMPASPFPTEAHGPRWCDNCSDHFELPGEAAGRRLTRLEDHDRRLRVAYAQTWQRARQYSDDQRRYRRSRDSWRGALVEVMALHEESPHGCKCGAESFPCSTWSVLEASNRGITKQVDKFLAMKDADRDEVLYRGDDWDALEDEEALN